MAMFYYIYIYMYLHDMSWISISFMVILGSTTGPFGRPMIEVAYGEMWFSLHRGCMGDDSLGRVVGALAWCRPCWTYPGQHQCELNIYYFLGFLIIKTYTYYVFKLESITGGLWLCPGSTRFKERFWPPIGFKVKVNTTNDFHEF